MSSSLLTLDSKGVIDDPVQKTHWLLSYMLTTEQSQSNQFGSYMVSLPDIIRRHGQNPPELRELIETSLKGVFNRYFDGSVVSVVTRDLPKEPGKFQVAISAQVLQNKKYYDVARSLTISKEKLEIVSELTQM